jgi:hypothetical protein
MKLSDIMSALHISVFAEIPLVIFFGVFVGVCLHLFSSQSEDLEALRSLPLDETPSRERNP